MEGVQRIQGRDLCESDIAQICSLISSHPDWCRTQLSVELAQTWNWRSATGQIQDMAARSLLLKLERRGWITLPPRRHEFYPRLPLNSSPLSLRAPTHDSGPVWAARPSPYDSFIHDISPVNPGAPSRGGTPSWGGGRPGRRGRG